MNKIKSGSLCSISGNLRAYAIKTKTILKPMRAYVYLDGNIVWVDDYDYEKVIQYKSKEDVIYNLKLKSDTIKEISLQDCIPGRVINYKGNIYIVTTHWYDETKEYSFNELMMLRTNKVVCVLNLDTCKLEYLFN